MVPCCYMQTCLAVGRRAGLLDTESQALQRFGTGNAPTKPLGEDRFCCGDTQEHVGAGRVVVTYGS